MKERKRVAVEAKLEAEKAASREAREADKAALLAQHQEAEEEIFRLQRRRITTFIAEKEIAHLKLLQPFIQTKVQSHLASPPTEGPSNKGEYEEASFIQSPKVVEVGLCVAGEAAHILQAQAAQPPDD